MPGGLETDAQSLRHGFPRHSVVYEIQSEEISLGNGFVSSRSLLREPLELYSLLG